MTDVPPPGDADTPPAERRVEELMALVRSGPAPVSPDFAPATVSRARTQRAVARPLRALATFLSSLAGALGAAATLGRGSRP